MVTAMTKGYSEQTAGAKLCIDLKNDQLNLEKVKKLEEYSGLESIAVFNYCAKIGVIDMATES